MGHRSFRVASVYVMNESKTDENYTHEKENRKSVNRYDCGRESH